MKILKFKGFKAEWVKDGTKTATMRLFDDKDIQAGDELELVNSDTAEVFAHGRVNEVIEKKVGEITEADLVGHEKYDSAEAMYANLKRWYGDRVTKDTLAKIIRFAVDAKER